MSVKSIKNHIDGVNWTIVSVILALLFGIFTVYVYYADAPNLTFDIINDANVFDVNKPLDELNISFQGDDIKKRNLNLRIISIKIENTGNTNILQNFYDENVIFGLKIDNGHIIESRLIDSNSEYLKSYLNLETINNTVEFSKPIFEKNKYFVVELLVLHDKYEVPKITPLGKIAGIEKIDVIKSYTESLTFFESVFSGSLFVHLIRFPIYLLILVGVPMLIFLVIYPITELIARRRKHKRTLLVKKLDLFDGEFTSKNKTIIEKILICTPKDEWGGMLDLLKIYKVDEKSLKPESNKTLEEFDDYYTPAVFRRDVLNHRYHPFMEQIYYLYKHNIFEETSDQDNSESNTKNKLKLNEQFLEELKSSISFLENI